MSDLTAVIEQLGEEHYIWALKDADGRTVALSDHDFKNAEDAQGHFDAFKARFDK